MLQYSLGIGLLQQGAPELVALRGVQEDQFPPVGREAIVDDHVHPLAVLPESAIQRLCSQINVMLQSNYMEICKLTAKIINVLMDIKLRKVHKLKKIEI